MTIMCIIVTDEDMTLNNIIMLIIVMDAQGFVAIMKFLGQAP